MVCGLIGAWKLQAISGLLVYNGVELGFMGEDCVGVIILVPKDVFEGDFQKQGCKTMLDGIEKIVVGGKGQRFCKWWHMWTGDLISQ